MRLFAPAVAILAAAVAPWGGPALAQRVQIAGLSDPALGTWYGAGDLVAEVEHCVQRVGNPRGRFNLLAQGSGSGGAFELSSGSSTLGYLLSYNDGSGWRDITAPDSSLTGLQGLWNTGQFNACLSGGSGSEFLRIRIPEANLSVAASGSYAGTLLLTVSPE
mgnify:CR=1 FL=1